MQRRLDLDSGPWRSRAGEGPAMGSRSIQDAPWRCQDLGEAGWEQHPPCLPGTQNPLAGFSAGHSSPVQDGGRGGLERGAHPLPPQAPKEAFEGSPYFWARKAWSGQARPELPGCDPFRWFPVIAQDPALRPPAPSAACSGELVSLTQATTLRGVFLTPSFPGREQSLSERR